jgi:hypothetical protein
MRSLIHRSISSFPSAVDVVLGVIALGALFALFLFTAKVASAQTMSPDGAVLTPTSTDRSSLVTVDGTWTFSPTVAQFGNVILLNGSPNNGGNAVLLEISSSKIFAKAIDSSWWEWANVSGWLPATAPVTPPLGSADITCTTPTKNTDGTTIAGAQLPLKLYFYEGLVPGPMYRQISPPQTSCAYTFGNLEPGVHYFAAIAVDAIGSSSGGSNEATKTIPPVPTPNAPSGLTVPASRPIAYTFPSTEGGLIKLAVGTAKPGATCHNDWVVNGYQRVDVANVDLNPGAGQVLVAFTTCN